MDHIKRKNSRILKCYMLMVIPKSVSMSHCLVNNLWKVVWFLWPSKFYSDALLFPNPSSLILKAYKPLIALAIQFPEFAVCSRYYQLVILKKESRHFCAHLFFSSGIMSLWHSQPLNHSGQTVSLFLYAVLYMQTPHTSTEHPMSPLQTPTHLGMSWYPFLKSL